MHLERELSFCQRIESEMTAEPLNRRVEETLKRNQVAVKQAAQRTERLNQAAEKSSEATDRALKQLRGKFVA
jgi:hypothetical protein